MTRIAIGAKVDCQNAASRCLVAGGAKAAAEAGRRIAQVGIRAEMHKRNNRPLLFSFLWMSSCSLPSLLGSVPVGSKRGGVREAAKSLVDVFALAWRCGCDSNVVKCSTSRYS